MAIKHQKIAFQLRAHQMSKAIILLTLIASGFSDLTWGVRCEYRGIGCSGGVASCAQFLLTNGCANDGTAFQITDGVLTTEEKACDSDYAMNMTTNATVNSYGVCIGIPGTAENSYNDRYVKFFATDDGDISLRSYALEDLELCNALPASSTDIVFDSYTMHSDPFTCTDDNILNRYTYVSKNNQCDQNGVKPVFDNSTLTVNQYNDVITCEAQEVDPVQYFYRTDGSCHIGRFQSISVGLFHSHVGLCGEPIPQAEEDTGDSVCQTDSQGSAHVASISAAFGVTAISMVMSIRN